MTEQVFLADDLKAAVDEAVAAGDYPSADAVVREALETWQRRRAEHTAAVEKVRRLWDEGIASGPAKSMDWDELKAEARNRWQSKSPRQKSRRCHLLSEQRRRTMNFLRFGHR